MQLTFATKKTGAVKAKKSAVTKQLFHSFLCFFFYFEKYPYCFSCQELDEINTTYIIIAC